MIRVNKYLLKDILTPFCVFAAGEEYSKDFDKITRTGASMRSSN